MAGLKRLPTAAVIAASGLRTGQLATRTQLDAAAQRLADTGFFASVTYEYVPKPVNGASGYALTFHVTEQTTLAQVELDIPGVEAETLWPLLKAANGLIDSQMPDNEHATAYYKRVIEEVLRKTNHPQEVVLKTEADLHSGKMVVICRSANVPRIAAIRFEGNHAVADRALQAAMAKVAVGQDFTERNFRRMLELNVRPLYEELGRLTAAFPRVSFTGSGDVTVTATIDEGPVWRLGKVAFTGDDLPLADMHEAARFDHGAPANWKQFTATLEKMEKVLRRDGYIRVSSKPVRAFQEAAQIVDVNVEVRKGRQFMFGGLELEGLDEATQQRLMKLWELPAGAPMNQLYIDDYLRAVMPVIRYDYRTVGSDMHIRPETNLVDVTIKFR